jgi:hypothetical protein
MKEPEFEVSERGFKRLKPIDTDYGEVLRIYESSSAMEPKVWMEVDFGASVCGQENYESASVHLTFNQIDEMIAQLKWIKKNHYNR